MQKVYACLLGNWVCLNDDPNCTVSDNHQSPYLWWKEGANVYAPTNRDEEIENSFYGLDYIKIFYQNKEYRINPVFIQIVNE